MNVINLLKMWKFRWLVAINIKTKNNNGYIDMDAALIRKSQVLIKNSDTIVKEHEN